MYRTPFGLTAFPGAIAESNPTVIQHTQARMTPSGPVCENGRPFVTDPCTGQAVCLCTVGSDGLPYPATLGSPDGLRALGHSPGSTEPSAFRSPLTCATGVRPERETWKALAPTLAHHYDPSLALHPYSTFYAGLDLNSAARRKAATRETTSPLKAWLNEHRKNPYPTKAEKIMLAIITKMTMTQVSTWFANARRRLKKENKMCWDVNERDDDDKDDDMSEKDSTADKSEGRPAATSVKSDDDDDDSEVQLSDISDVEDNAQNPTARLQPDSHVLHADTHQEAHVATDYSLPHPPVLRDNQSANICAQNRNSSAPKPKIWSISHILEPKEESSTQSETDNTSTTLTSSHLALTSSRLTSSHDHPTSHMSHEHSGHTSVFSSSLGSPRYRIYESNQEKTPSPRKSSPGGHPRPPLDTPPDTPPFDNQQASSTYFKEQRNYEYEALNLKTDKTRESPRT